MNVPQNGYRHARRLTWLISGTFHMLEWARVVADSVFLAIGVVPLVLAVAVQLPGARKGGDAVQVLLAALPRERGPACN